MRTSPAVVATFGSAGCLTRGGAEQSGGELLGGSCQRGLRGLLRRHRRWGLSGVLRGSACQADHLLGNLKLLIFVAQPFKLQPEHPARRRGQLAPDGTPDARQKEVAGGAAQRWQSRLGDAL